MQSECTLLFDNNVTGFLFSPFLYKTTNLSFLNYGILSELLTGTILIILTFPFSMIRKKRITFNHIKGVIDLLEKNIYKIKSPLGNKIYKPSRKKIHKNGIVYKLNRYGDFISVGLSRYNIIIDGNSIIIEAPSARLKKIVKILEAYSE